MIAALKFELVSPEKLVVSKDAAMVTVPGGEGDYSVLAGHAPLITTVRPGVIDIYDQDDGAPNERLFVAGGFAETTAERCTVLAEQVIAVDQLDRAKAEEDLRSLNERLNANPADGERARLENDLAVARAKIMAAA